MFIPNKTYQAMRTAGIAVIAVLVLVIAAQAVTYTKTTQATKGTIDSLQAVMDTQAVDTRDAFRSSEARQDGTDVRFNDLQALVAQQGQQIVDLQSSLAGTRMSVEKLLRNECTPETAIYVLTRDMVAVCRTLGTMPPQF
jgi:hypothetical protein